MSQYIYIGLQLAVVLLGFLSLFYVMSKEEVKDKDILATAVLAAIQGTLGYLFQITAHSPGEALLAMKFSLMGKCFVVTLMLLFIGRYLGIITGKKISRLIFASDFTILFFLLTSEYHTFFYREVSFAGELHFERLTPGPVYNYYLLSQIVKLVSFIYFTNVCMKRNSLVSAKFRICMLFSGVMPLSTLALIVLDFERGFDISSMSYTFALAVLLAAVTKIGMMDTVEEAKKSAIENMTDGMMVLDHDMQLLYANRVAKEIFLDYGKYSLNVQKRLRESMVKGQYETYHSGEKTYEIRTAPVGEEQRHRGYMILIIDVTEREKKEQEILALKSETENASKAKSQFLRNISHEFRTPMNTINGMTKILQNADLTAAERSNLEQLKQAADKLQRMLNDVLDYSKIDSGKMHLIQVEYPLQELIRRVYQNMIKKVEQKNLEFIVEIDEDTPRAYFGDDLKIQQILESVIGNAVKFTSQGQIFLKVSGTMESLDNCRLLFKIQDTGNGIRQEDYDWIFGEFNQGDREMENQDGTGLGLSLARRLALLMDGDITFVSTLGLGTEFVVSICQRVVDAEPVELGNLFQEERIPDFIAPDAEVAVVDDSPINLKVAEHALHYYQMKIHQFQNGQEFLEEVEKGLRVDLILMDQMMPDLDGKGTLKLFRTYHQTTPVVLLASNVIEGVREEMLEAGFTECVFKPLREEKLKEILYHTLPKEKILLEQVQEEAEELEEGEDKEYLKERVERLENSLEYYDLVKAERILDELDQGIIRTDMQEALKEIEQLLREADFEKALERVRELHKSGIR